MKRSMPSSSSSPLNDSVNHYHDGTENHDELLTLSLSTGTSINAASSSSALGQTYSHQYLPMATVASPPPPPPQFLHSFYRVSPSQSTLHQEIINTHVNSSTAAASGSSSASASSSYVSGSSSASPSSRGGSRKSSARKLRPGKTDTISPPYIWATNRRAIVHSFDHLTSLQIHKISGRVQCKRCDQKYEIEYDLQVKFMEVASFVSENRYMFNDRAPPIWMNPNLPNCKLCGQSNCVKPILGKKRSINWLFLFLGQMLGCCKLSELKYFCKHTSNHRTGAKDRVLYLTYLGICKQLDPKGPFDVSI